MTACNLKNEVCGFKCTGYEGGKIWEKLHKLPKEIECDKEDKELKFELTNIGKSNWFLIDQALTNEAKTSAGYKELNGPLTEATQIKLYINNFLVNNLIDKYWMGEKLFYSEGKTFADAARADFLRMGKTTRVKLEPIPVRTGLLANDYLLLATGFTERGKFICE